MSDNVKIELTPYTAISLLAFLKEFINDSNKDDIRFAPIHESVAEYEQQIYQNMTMDQVEDATVDNSVNELTGRWPTEKKDQNG